MPETTKADLLAALITNCKVLNKKALTQQLARENACRQVITLFTELLGQIEADRALSRMQWINIRELEKLGAETFEPGKK